MIIIETMMAHRLKFPLILMLIGTWAPGIAQQPSSTATEEKKVLFVGNSYTYFWNLPQIVQGFAREEKKAISTKQSTAGGADLGQHWRGDKGLKSKSIIEDEDFDIVILQDHSMRAIHAPDSLTRYGMLFGELIKSKHAQPYVYMTWSRKWDPYMIDDIRKEYTRLAERINARIVPVGLAWQRALELRPDLPLYDDDGSHPSALGTYLTACVFYGMITGASPVGLPARLISEDQFGEKLYLTIQSVENALFCQKVAAQIITDIVD